MTDQLRILFFSPVECFPANTGARLRNYYLSRLLSRHAQVTFLAFSEEEGIRERVFTGSSSWGPQKVILVPREKGYTFGKVVRGAIGRTPLNVLNYTTRGMAEVLRRVLDENDFDIVQMESLLLTSYLPAIRTARSRPIVVCDWHNIDSEVMRRYSRFEPSLPRKLYAQLTTKRLEALERASVNRFDAHLTVSERDQQRLLELGTEAAIVVATNGVDTAFYSENSSTTGYRRRIGNNGEDLVRRRRILFVGSMDYYANADAVANFTRDVWIDFHKENPEFVFTIVGRNPSEEVRKLKSLPGIEVTGTVPDVRPYYHEALASIVPLRIGGGTRLKILESMAAGVPVISTQLGVEGIAVSDQENVLLAESKEEFSRALLALSSNIRLRNRLSKAGLKLVQAKYDWERVGGNIVETLESLTTKARLEREAQICVLPSVVTVRA